MAKKLSNNGGFEKLINNVKSSISTHNTDATAHNDIREDVEDIHSNKLDKSGGTMTGDLTIEDATLHITKDTRDYKANVSSNCLIITEGNSNALSQLNNNGVFRTMGYIYQSNNSYDRVANLSETTIPVVEPTTSSSYTLDANKDYDLGTLTGPVTISLGTPTDDIVNIYSFSFTSDTVPPILFFQSSVVWLGGTAPTFKANKVYEISIKDNKAIYGEF